MKNLLLLLLVLPLLASSQTQMEQMFPKEKIAYDKDCFNDSINIHTAMRIDCWDLVYEKMAKSLPVTPESYSINVCLNPYHYQYIHRKPTEDGFAEFLKVMPKGGL